MIKLIQCFVWLVVIPIILGMIPTNFIKKEKNSIIYSFVSGYIMQFAVLQLIVVPMIFLKCSLKIVICVFCPVIVFLCIISIILNRKKYKEIIVSNIECIKKMPISIIVVIILIAGQMFNYFYYTHIDDDDAFYLGTAETAIKTNTLYKYNCLTGDEYAKIPARYVLSPFPIYIAVISSCIFIHPTIVAHSVLSVMFLVVAYGVYVLIAKRLFENDYKSINLFIIILSIIYMWGNYSIRSNFSFTLMRIWQGKAILSGIMLPLILICAYDCFEEESTIANWIVLAVCIIAASFLSEMALALAPMALMVYALVFSIKERKIKYVIKSLLCSISCIIYLCIYLIIK